MEPAQTHELISAEEFSRALKLRKLRMEQLAPALMRFLKIDQVNRLHAGVGKKQGHLFAEDCLAKLDIEFEFGKDELKNIPAKEPFIIVSNHPYGGLDGLILLALMGKLRPDMKIAANYLLRQIPGISQMIIPINPFEKSEPGPDINIAGLRRILATLKTSPVVLFPAGEVSSLSLRSLRVEDRAWSDMLGKIVMKTGVRVVPVFFSGQNSFVFSLLGLINPKLRTLKLPSEMFNKHGKIEVRIGKPVDPKLLIDFGNKEQITRYLRAKTYALGSGKFHDPGSLKAKFGSTRRVRDIIDPTPLADLLGEIRSNKKNLLITHGEYQVYCCEAIQIPAILREISRLREICFREVGEGTNRPFDLDEFDFYYRHLFVWSTGDQQLVGAYRLGAGDELMSAFGKKGFYLSQLFHIKDEFAPVLKNALELGRAFIAKQYQRRPLPLVLLWKGIYQFALRDEGRFRYLIGPVSISNSFSKLSKELLVDYIRKNYFDETYAKYIRPRKRFKYAFDEYTDTLSREHAASIQSLDGLIEEIEHYKLRIPVLIKKYLQLNARIIAFNLDPKFNNSLDGFLMINIDHIPEKAFDLIHRK